MNRLILACAVFLTAGMAQAQSANGLCPTLPADAGLRWEVLQPPGIVFCRALRSNGSEALAVTISRENPFKPRRSNRREETQIDGIRVNWYESEIAGLQTLSRETLVEYDNGVLMHISLRAPDRETLAQTLQQAQQLRYEPSRFPN